jgi:hypothetical protein
MSQKAEPLDTFLNVIFSDDFDRQKAYVSARKVALERKVAFNGIITVMLPTIPQTFGDSVSFTVGQNQINAVFEAFLADFGVEKSKVRLSLTPVPSNMPSAAPNIFH